VMPSALDLVVSIVSSVCSETEIVVSLDIQCFNRICYETRTLWW